jgi:prepilin-type N-terminal cleavage/methylation domain-containing protein
LCPRTDGSKHKRHAGFTLVEVIVVLVILAILAAIAIPALTGYIEKAQNKQYIAEARNIAVAERTVFNEAYAASEFKPNSQDGDFMPFFTGGNGLYKIKSWPTSTFSKYIPPYSDSDDRDLDDILTKRACELIGIPFPAELANPGSWVFIYRGSADSTIFNVDGFSWLMYPEGNSDDSRILVTYKLKHLDITTYSQFSTALKDTDLYDPKAGYEVYHLTK